MSFAALAQVGIRPELKGPSTYWWCQVSWRGIFGVRDSMVPVTRVGTKSASC